MPFCMLWPDICWKIALCGGMLRRCFAVFAYVQNEQDGQTSRLIRLVYTLRGSNPGPTD